MSTGGSGQAHSPPTSASRPRLSQPSIAASELVVLARGGCLFRRAPPHETGRDVDRRAARLREGAPLKLLSLVVGELLPFGTRRRVVHAHVVVHGRGAAAQSGMSAR
jgi:hypothetical protein